MSQPKFRKLGVQELVIDHEYQRPLDPKWVERTSEHFDPALLGALEVSRRNGHYAVFDGQHRLAVLKNLSRDVAPCLVHEGLTSQDEARLFVALQDKRRHAKPVDRFKAAVHQGEPEACAIKKIVEDFGLSIGQGRDGSSPSDRLHIEAIGALRFLYGRGMLEETLEFVNDLWAGDVSLYTGRMLEGVGRLLIEYGDRLGGDERERLAELSPKVIQRRAQARMTSFSPGGRALSVTQELRAIAKVRGRPKVVGRSVTHVEHIAQ